MSNFQPLIPYDVVIAGAGPVGLLLACELRLSGVSVLVLERTEGDSSPLKRLPFGVRGLSASSLDALHRRGLLDELLAEQRSRDAVPAHVAQQNRRPAGHFAGIQFFHDDIDVSRWRHRLPSAAGSSLAIEMESLETVLAARARALGVEIRRGLEVETFERSDDDVTVRAGGETFRTTWLVGCDGGRSTVRKAGGFDFVGTDPEFTGYFVDVELADPDALQPGRHYSPTGMYTFARPGTIAMVAFDGGAFHRSGEITLEHVQAVLRRVSGTDVTVTSVRLATTWTDRAQQVTDYRIGRVLLAGDAAHIHSPLGGQGLNLGLGDAMNLGWKLAATIRGHAPAGLLDTYSRERRPVGLQVLDWSRAQVTLMRPTPNTRALEAIVRDLIATRDGATYFAERIWGVSLRYDLGDDHPLVGRGVPDFALADGTNAGSLLRDGRGLWLDFASRPARRTLANGWSDRMTYVASNVADRLGVESVLVRPDGVVAWVSETDGDDGSAARIAARWFGEPAAVREQARV